MPNSMSSSLTSSTALSATTQSSAASSISSLSNSNPPMRSIYSLPGSQNTSANYYYYSHMQHQPHQNYQTQPLPEQTQPNQQQPQQEKYRSRYDNEENEEDENDDNEQDDENEENCHTAVIDSHIRENGHTHPIHSASLRQYYSSPRAYSVNSVPNGEEQSMLNGKRSSATAVLSMPKYIKPKLCKSPMIIHAVSSRHVVKPQPQTSIILPSSASYIVTGLTNESSIANQQQQQHINQSFIPNRSSIFLPIQNQQGLRPPLPPILNQSQVVSSPAQQQLPMPLNAQSAQLNSINFETQQQRSNTQHLYTTPLTNFTTTSQGLSQTTQIPFASNIIKNDNYNQSQLQHQQQFFNDHSVNSIEYNDNRAKQTNAYPYELANNSFGNSSFLNTSAITNSSINTSAYTINSTVAATNNLNQSLSSNYHALLVSPYLRTLFDKKPANYPPPPPYPGKKADAVSRSTNATTIPNDSSNMFQVQSKQALLSPSSSPSSSIIRYCSPQAFKFYMEQHAENVLKNQKAREYRRQQLENEMSKMDLPDSIREDFRKLLRQKETNYLRLRRAKLNASMFELLKQIGRGAFGRVYLVRKRDETDKLFAMKVLHKSDVFNRNQAAHVKAERDILAEADNEWVVKLYYSFQDEENLYFVMDYVPGGDLMNLLIKLEVFSEELARFYIGELTCAIESVHALGFIHRDIKPDNILIDKNGHIKLTDFGLCTGFHWTHNSKYYQIEDTYNRILERKLSGNINATTNNNTNGTINNSNTNLKPSSSQRLLAHSLVGTPNYIAPEILSRKGKIIIQ
jgi:tRNA A-37 threonylcarbamoyl transferase component Bud32